MPKLDTIQINTGKASRVSEETAVLTMAHELYGHALLFRQNNKNWSGHGPIFDKIEKRTINNYRLGKQR
ncbi:MAG: hypothetical protein KatS3mg006_0323 [Pyrinomonadaceae bacterium]|nr:MAG: hypothetical protein KatS3mg006_0323 [Pyrinomonadaceae bacterium]